MLESNLEELERMRRLSDNILFLARADNAATDLDRSDVSLAVELARIADYFEGPAAGRGIRFEVEAEGHHPGQCRPFSPRGRQSRRQCGPPRHRRKPGAHRRHGRWRRGARIVVENRGHPLSGEQLARVFDRFYRVDPARNDATESSGLGLAIVQAIMVLHGGRAEATCSDDGLFRFTLTFP